MQTRKTKKLLTYFLILTLLLTLCQGMTPGPVAEAAVSLRNPRRNADDVVTWDCVYFGNYWQSDTNGDGTADKKDKKQPIKWRVLSVEGDDAFLVADHNLDTQTYNDTETDVTWETCTMRSWLNGYGASVNDCKKDYTANNFMDNAFTSGEQAAIRKTDVVNEDNPDYGTEGGNDTQDKVYLLSIGDVTNPAYGFSSNTDSTATREALNTRYVADGGEIKVGDMCSAEVADNWWLRSPDDYSDVASNVDSIGCVEGTYVNDDYCNAVRPALHLNLSSTSNWSYAGTVSAEGETDEQATSAPEESPEPTVLSTPTAATTTRPEASPIVSPASMRIGNPHTTDGVTTWDCVWFGNYWQEDTNGDGKADKNDNKQPIKWRVLSVEGDDAFLVADQNMDCQTYNDTYTDVTWETCTMRSWLNGYGVSVNDCKKDYTANNFMDNAFTSGEQAAIRTTAVVNEDNPEYNTEGGNDTQDKVYLLSIGEVTNPAYGISSKTDSTATREALNTRYVAGGGEIDSSYMNSAGSTDAWLLRSPGKHRGNASFVYYYGDIDWYGNHVSYNYYAVRPALHLNLSSSDLWSYAGQTTSERETDEQATFVPAERPEPTVLSTPTGSPTVHMDSTAKPEASPVVSPASMEIGNPRTIDGVTTWDCVWFGNYWQDDTNGDGTADKKDKKQPIKWRVLSVEGDDAFLLADKNLDVQMYDDTYTDVTWETCTMRSWLNGYGASANVCKKDYTENNFMDNAFISGEQAAVTTTDVVNEDNPEYGTEGGNNTQDKVYLLSIGDVTNPAYGFTISDEEDAKNRRALNTDYAKAQGALASTSGEYAGSGDWWLRSPGGYSFDASYVDYDGYVDRYGDSVLSSFNAVRPALHLNLSSTSAWSYAGTVSSEGGADEQATFAPAESPEPTMLPAPIGSPKPTVASTIKPTLKPTTSPAVSPAPIGPPKPPVTSQKPAAPSTGLPGVAPVATTGEKQQTGDTEMETLVSLPGKPVIKSVKNKKGRKIKIKLKKKVKGAAGYRVQYARNKKFTKAKKSKDVGAWKSAKTITGLKKGKTYYVRVRAYQNQAGIKVYGKWSKAKKVQIKR